MERLGQQPEKQPSDETENLSIRQKIKALGSKALESFVENNPYRYQYAHLMDIGRQQELEERLYSPELDGPIENNEGEED